MHKRVDDVLRLREKVLSDWRGRQDNKHVLFLLNEYVNRSVDADGNIINYTLHMGRYLPSVRISLTEGRTYLAVDIYANGLDAYDIVKLVVKHKSYIGGEDRYLYICLDDITEEEWDVVLWSMEELLKMSIPSKEELIAIDIVDSIKGVVDEYDNKVVYHHLKDGYIAQIARGNKEVDAVTLRVFPKHIEVSFNKSILAIPEKEYQTFCKDYGTVGYPDIARIDLLKLTESQASALVKQVYKWMMPELDSISQERLDAWKALSAKMGCCMLKHSNMDCREIVRILEPGAVDETRLISSIYVFKTGGVYTHIYEDGDVKDASLSDIPEDKWKELYSTYKKVLTSYKATERLEAL